MYKSIRMGLSVVWAEPSQEEPSACCKEFRNNVKPSSKRGLAQQSLGPPVTLIPASVVLDLTPPIFCTSDPLWLIWTLSAEIKMTEECRLKEQTWFQSLSKCWDAEMWDRQGGSGHENACRQVWLATFLPCSPLNGQTELILESCLLASYECCSTHTHEHTKKCRNDYW